MFFKRIKNAYPQILYCQTIFILPILISNSRKKISPFICQKQLTPGILAPREQNPISPSQGGSHASPWELTVPIKPVFFRPLGALCSFLPLDVCSCYSLPKNTLHHSHCLSKALRAQLKFCNVIINTNTFVLLWSFLGTS